LAQENRLLHGRHVLPEDRLVPDYLSARVDQLRRAALVRSILPSREARPVLSHPG
jgi:hypothetical protein